MTHKHFEAIAETLNANVAPLALVLDFADMCEETNPLFDRARFITAATINLLDSEARTVRMIELASRPRKKV
jgi:hypothetical protein